MSEIYEFLLKKAETLSESKPEVKKKLDWFSHEGMRLGFKSFFKELQSQDPKELIILFLHHLCRLFAADELEIEYTERLSEWISWMKISFKEDVTNEIFNEIDVFFAAGFMKNVQRCENISEFNRIYRIAQIMIEANANKDSYHNIIKFKLTPLIWRSIKKIVEGNSDKQEMIGILYGINVAQYHGIPVESTAIHYISVVQDYIIYKNDVFGIAEESVKGDDEEASNLLASIKMINIDDEILLNQRQILLQKFKVPETQIVPVEIALNTEITFNLIEENLKFHSQIYFHQFSQFKAGVDIFIYNSEKIAVKKYTKKDDIPLNIDKIMVEITVNTILSQNANDGNCFLKYYGTKLVDDSVSLYMEYHPMTLDEKITIMADEQSNFNTEELKKLIRKLIHSFKIMEELNIYHRDIKPSNLLFTEAGDIKIIDFSVSEMKIPDQNTSTLDNHISVSGTPAFMAPEVHEAYINRQKRVEGWSEKADIFSLGMTILQMINLKKLDSLNFRENNEDLIKVVENNVKDNAIKILLKRMLNIEPQSRPTFGECLNYFLSRDTT